MVKEIAIILAMLTAGSGAATSEAKPMEKPPRAEINYVVEHQPRTLEERFNDNVTADERFEQRKMELEEKYARLFDLEKQIKENREQMKETKMEYHALKKAYEREFAQAVYERAFWTEQSK